MRAANQ